MQFVACVYPFLLSLGEYGCQLLARLIVEESCCYFMSASPLDVDVEAESLAREAMEIA